MAPPDKGGTDDISEVFISFEIFVRVAVVAACSNNENGSKYGRYCVKH